jgi:excisionase family DNA binding protein
MQEQLAVSIPEAARRLGLSIRTIATLVSRRELASRKVGRRRIIPVAALEAFVLENPNTSCNDLTKTRDKDDNAG